MRLLRKKFHEAERKWLKAKDKSDRKAKRLVYLECRRGYLKAVRSAKKRFLLCESKRLEGLMDHPVDWWKEAKRLDLVKSRWVANL